MIQSWMVTDPQFPIAYAMIKLQHAERYLLLEGQCGKEETVIFAAAEIQLNVSYIRVAS